MLSGFFGLIAIVTSAGLIASGAVMRTTCCAFDVMAMKGIIRRNLVHEFIDSLFTVIVRSLLHLTHKERTETFQKLVIGRERYGYRII